MYLLIKEPGLIFNFRNTEYVSPVEFKFNDKQIDSLLIQLRAADIDNYIISKHKIAKNKIRIENNINTNKIVEVKNENENNKQSENNEINDLKKLLIQLGNNLNNLERKIDDKEFTKHVYHGHDSYVEHDKKVKLEDDIEIFIPDIDLSGMDSEISNDIKIEKSEDNQENSADLLRKILGE